MRHSFHLLANVLALMIGVFFTGLGLAILIVYGIFRLFRLYLNLKNRRNEE